LTVTQQVALARAQAQSRAASSSVGRRRTDNILVQPLPQTAHPLGEEAAELSHARPVRRGTPCVAACGIRP